MEYSKELMDKIREINSKVVFTPEMREEQMIGFAKGNTFDVFTKDKRLTKEKIKEMIYGKPAQ